MAENEKQFSKCNGSLLYVKDNLHQQSTGWVLFVYNGPSHLRPLFVLLWGNQKPLKIHFRSLCLCPMSTQIRNYTFFPSTVSLSMKPLHPNPFCTFLSSQATWQPINKTNKRSSCLQGDAKMQLHVFKMWCSKVSFDN